jgi:hypothetical protein
MAARYIWLKLKFFLARQTVDIIVLTDTQIASLVGSRDVRQYAPKYFPIHHQGRYSIAALAQMAGFDVEYASQDKRTKRFVRR